MHWRKDMDLHDIAIELFCRFDPDQRGYITQEQLVNCSVKDNFFSEGQIISVFALLDKEEKGVITLSDFTDAFVDVSVSDSDAVQTPCVDVRHDTFSNSNENISENENDNENVGVSGPLNGTCDCPCSKSFNCRSKLKVRCCMYDRMLKNSTPSYSHNETPRSIRPDTPRYAKRRFGLRKSSLTRRGSLPSLAMGKRADSLPKLLKSKRWKSYDYGMNKHFVTLNEEEDNKKIINGDYKKDKRRTTTNGFSNGDYKGESRKTNEICNGENDESPTTNGLSNGGLCNGEGEFRESHLPSTDTLCSRHSLDSSDCFYSETSSGGRITRELDEIFGGTENDNATRTGCTRCNLNRKSHSNSLSVLPNNVFFTDTSNGVKEEGNLFTNRLNGSGMGRDQQDVINSKREDRTKNNFHSRILRTPTKKNGFVASSSSSSCSSSRKEVVDSHEKEDENGDVDERILSNSLHRENMFDEEWENYLRRIGGVSLFSGNQTLQYLWQQIKLYQADLTFLFDKFLRTVIEEHKIAYAKCHETEDTLNLKIEQHEKEIGSLYEEFDVTREKEIKQQERKQYEREEYLKAEFRKIIDYKEQAYQDCCKQMADISERLEHYEEDMANLNSTKRKAEEQCRFLLQEQQRYLTENRHLAHENELLKQKYKSCANSLTDLQEHLNQLKKNAEEERGKHRGVMQQYNDIVDEKTFLETSVANLAMENNELRNLSRSLGPLEEKINVSIELSDFPILTSSPVAKRFLKKLSSNHPAMSLHEEINSSSFGENEKKSENEKNEDNTNNNNNNRNNNNNNKSNDSGSNSINSDKNMSDKSSTQSNNSTTNYKSSVEDSLLREIEEEKEKTSSKTTTRRNHSNSSKKSDVKSDNIHQECYNITHHFIECEKLSIRTITAADESSIMNKSVWSGYDPLLNQNMKAETESMRGKSNRKEKHINLAPPYQSEFKVIFCGDCNVGKTSLIYRICFNDFRESLHEDTKAVDTFLKNVVTSGQNFKLKLWDTVGQEKYNSIPHSYYRKSDVAVIMYDITQEISFNNAKTWLDTVQQYSEDILVIILGNKMDLNSTRTVLKQKGEKFAKENQAIYLETSAKSGENIERLLYLITTKLLDKNEFVLIQNYFEQSYITSSPSKRSCCN